MSLEFVLFEQKSSHLSDIPYTIANFAKQIHDIDNCSLQTYLPGLFTFFFHGLKNLYIKHKKNQNLQKYTGCLLKESQSGGLKKGDH